MAFGSGIDLSTFQSDYLDSSDWYIENTTAVKKVRLATSGRKGAVQTSASGALPPVGRSWFGRYSLHVLRDKNPRKFHHVANLIAELWIALCTRNAQPSCALHCILP